MQTKRCISAISHFETIRKGLTAIGVRVSTLLISFFDHLCATRGRYTGRPAENERVLRVTKWLKVFVCYGCETTAYFALYDMNICLYTGLCVKALHLIIKPWKAYHLSWFSRNNLLTNFVLYVDSCLHFFFILSTIWSVF